MATKLGKDEIVEAIGSLTVLELADLVKTLEDKFGVSAAAPMAVAAGPMAGGAGAGAAAAEEQTEFDAVRRVSARRRSRSSRSSAS